MRQLLALLIIIGLAAASSVFISAPTTANSALLGQVNILLSVLVMLMIVMIVIAAAVYVAGQMFGAETRARATVWAQNMIAAVIVSAVIIAITYYIPTNFLGGQVSDTDLEVLISGLVTLAQTTLGLLALLLLVLAALAYAMGQMSGAETRARATVWAGGLLSGALVAIAIYLVVFQLIGELSLTFFAGTALALYGPVIVNIVLFSTVFILGTYMMSKVFKISEWEAYLSIELSNLLASFFLMAFVLGLFVAGSAVALTYTGGGFSSPPQAAISYMRSVVADSTLRASIDVYKIQACTSILSTFSRRIGEFVLTQTYKVFPGLDTFVSITGVLGSGLIMLYNTVAVQITLLHVVDAFMIPFILPAGVVLRFFPPTRDAGAFLISLAFGFQIVFPMTYMLNKEVYETIYPDPADRGYHSPWALIQRLCGPLKYGAAGFFFNTGANPIFSVLPGLTTVGNMLARVVSEGLLNMMSMSEFIPIMRHLASLSLLAIFMPALSMMVTIAFINSMTKFIVSKV
jgi:hypothetical protein